MTTQAEKGQAFRALHQRDHAFIIPNPWDAGTARLLAHLGFEALASTSGGYASSIGVRDYAVGREAMIAHVGALASATNLPVSADLENGFADAPGVVAKTISLPAGSRPMSVKLSPDESRLYVSNGRAGTISVFDTHSYELLDTIKVGARPWGIGVSPDGKFLFAANGPSNDVSVVDLQTNKEVSRIKAGSSPWGIAIISQ